MRHKLVIFVNQLRRKGSLASHETREQEGSIDKSERMGVQGETVGKDVTSGESRGWTPNCCYPQSLLPSHRSCLHIAGAPKSLQSPNCRSLQIAAALKSLLPSNHRNIRIAAAPKSEAPKSLMASNRRPRHRTDTSKSLNPPHLLPFKLPRHRCPHVVEVSKSPSAPTLPDR